MSIEHVDQLKKTHIGNLKIGDFLYLVRNISGHLIRVEIDSFSLKGTEFVEAHYNNQNRYKINIKTGIVHSLTGNIKSRQNIKQWFKLWSMQKEPLLNSIREYRKNYKVIK